VGKPIEDTIVLAYLAGEPLLGLKELTSKLLGREAMDYPGSLENKPVELQARYACSDTRNTYDLYHHFMARLDADTRRAYETIERPLVPVIADMERDGSPVSLYRINVLQKEYRRLEDALRSFCWQRWRRDVSNDKETRALLTDLLGYDPGTLDQRVLSRIQEEWMDVIIGYRKIRTIRRNYLDKYARRFVTEDAISDGQGVEPTLKARFNQAGGSSSLSGRNFKSAPRTGRLSSADPNLMQVAPHIRSIFIPPPRS
jgi:DNA polymerase-1